MACCRICDCLHSARLIWLIDLVWDGITPAELCPFLFIDLAVSVGLVLVKGLQERVDSGYLVLAYTIVTFYASEENLIHTTVVGTRGILRHDEEGS